MTFVLFSKVESFLRRILVSRKLQYSIWYHEISVFSESCLSQGTLQKIDCVFVLAIRGLLHMTKNFVMWSDFCALITIAEIFSLKSFP